MSFDHIVALVSASISFTGLLFVAIQIREATRQRESESLVKIYDINRQLLSLGFDHPKLFGVLSDGKDTDPVLTRYYLQLWLNQYEQVHFHIRRSLFRTELRESLNRDLLDFMAMKNAQRHWQEFGKFYPTSFQDHVNSTLKKLEPPVKAAQAAHH